MAETEGILQTPNIGLYKPDYANIADIQVLNENFDKLDTTIKQAGDDLISHNIATEAHENRFNQYFPLTGGTLKGDIVFTEGKDIYNSADNGMTVSSNPANAEKSSKLVLSPKSTGGAFSLYCGDGTNEGILTAYPTGELYWNGSDIKNPIKNASISGKVITLTFANGTTKKLTTQDTAINYMPSTSKITIALSGDQQDYTAPADGFISVSCKTTVSSCIQAFALVNNTNNMQISQTMHSSGKMARGFMPVSKGHNITVYWADGGTNTRNMEFVHING